MSDVYYNLHRKCLSIRERGRVIAHAPRVLIRNAAFVVSEAGRQRVLRTGHKNVHAVVRGEIVPDDNLIIPLDQAVQVRYNPRNHETFVRATDSSPILRADLVWIDGRVMMAVEHLYGDDGNGV